MQGYDSGVFLGYFGDRKSKTAFHWLCILPLAAVATSSWCAMISNDLIPQFSLALRGQFHVAA